MADRPITPPPERMIREQLTPDHTFASFSELVLRTSPRFQANDPMKRGTLYSSTVGADVNISSSFPTLYFLRQTVPLGFSDLRGMPNDQMVRWFWSTVPDAESNFNAQISYMADAVANPAYVRITTVKRETYETTPSVATNTPLTAVIGIKVTAGGSAYTTATTVSVAMPNSGSDRALAEPVIAGGVLIGIIVTYEGSGYTTAPVVTIADTGGGTLATATSIIQPQTAVLTSQKKQELPDNDPMALEYVVVTKTFETLPGPYIPFTRYSEDLGPIQGRRRLVLNTGQVTTVTATVKTTYEGREGSSVVLWELTETNSDGTGSAGNPAYPILVKDFYDDERGAVQQSSQIVVATGSEVGSLSASGGIATRITYEPYADNPALLRKIIETWSQTGPQLAGQNLDPTFGIPEQFTVQLVATGSAGLSTANREIKPLNAVQSQITDINTTALTTYLNSYSNSFPGTANLDLPDKLVSLTGIMEFGQGEGEYVNDEAHGEATDHGSWSVSVRGSGDGSAVIMPDLQANIQQTYARNVPTINYLFFMAAPVTAAAFNTRIAALVGASVSAWPKFRPAADTFTLTGRRLSVSANVDGAASESFDELVLSYTAGHGSSRSTGMNVRTVRLPPTIHGSVSVSGATTLSKTADAEAHSVVGSAFPGLDEDVTISDTITATIAPTSLSATSGASVIPTSGKYLLDSHSSPWKYNYVQCHAEILDFADV